MFGLVFEEVLLLLSFVLVNKFPLGVFLLEGVLFVGELDSFFVQFPLVNFKLLYFFFELGFSLLRLKLFTHSKSYGTLVESLVSSDRHLEFVSDSKKKDTSLWAVDGDLSNNLIETLRMKFLSNRTDAGLPRLSSQYSFIKQFLQISDVLPLSWLVRNVLNIMFSLMSPLPWWQQVFQNIFSRWF